MATAIYRGYDRAQLDAQLNLRARVPEHGAHFARWAESSRAVRDTRPGQLDLAYGDSPGERLDLFAVPGLRPGDAGTPLLAFIHGGYWQALDKSDFSYLAPAYLDAGIAFASLNYDLAPGAPIGRMVSQIRSALAWLYANARTYGIDPERIFVSGHSAGGHLAAMTMTAGWCRDRGLPEGLVRGGCALSGIYELTPIRLSYHQEVVGLDADTVATCSPLRLAPAGRGELICAVGGLETDEFLAQQAELATAWRSAGQRVSVLELPGRNHFTAVDALAEPDHSLFAAVLDLALDGRASA